MGMPSVSSASCRAFVRGGPDWLKTLTVYPWNTNIPNMESCQANLSLFYRILNALWSSTPLLIFDHLCCTKTLVFGSDITWKQHSSYVCISSMHTYYYVCYSTYLHNYLDMGNKKGILSLPKFRYNRDYIL